MMKWVLIAVILSDWNHAPLHWHAIGEYEIRSVCEAERDKIADKAENVRYVCANKAIEKDENP